MKVILKKNGKGFFPYGRAAEEWAGKVTEGESILADARKPRNPKHHAKMYAIARRVVENQDHFQTVEQLIDYLKIKTGHVRMVVGLGGEIYYVPDSIDFASTGQKKFEAFYDRAMDVICTHVIPGMDRQTLENEAFEEFREAAE